jgi:DnaD/phage-associated family protein
MYNKSTNAEWLPPDRGKEYRPFLVVSCVPSYPYRTAAMRYRAQLKAVYLLPGVTMTYRNTDTKMWKDDWFLDLEPREKLFFIYLFTNESTTLTGLYKIGLKVIEFETGLSREFISKTFDKFARDGKVFYDAGVIWVVNLRKYNDSRSPKVQSRIDWELSQIPDCIIKNRYKAHNIQYQYSIDTNSENPPLTIQYNTVQDSTSKTASAEIFQTYEENISLLTPMLSEKIGSWIDDYPEAWITDAIKEAVNNNVRKPAYIEKILKTWQAEGRTNGKKPYRPEDYATEVYQ